MASRCAASFSLRLVLLCASAALGASLESGSDEVALVQRGLSLRSPGAAKAPKAAPKAPSGRDDPDEDEEQQPQAVKQTPAELKREGVTREKVKKLAHAAEAWLFNAIPGISSLKMLLSPMITPTINEFISQVMQMRRYTLGPRMRLVVDRMLDLRPKDAAHVRSQVAAMKAKDPQMTAFDMQLTKIWRNTESMLPDMLHILNESGFEGEFNQLQKLKTLVTMYMSLLSKSGGIVKPLLDPVVALVNASLTGDLAGQAGALRRLAGTRADILQRASEPPAFVMEWLDLLSNNTKNFLDVATILQARAGKPELGNNVAKLIQNLGLNINNTVAAATAERLIFASVVEGTATKGDSAAVIIVNETLLLAQGMMEDGELKLSGNAAVAFQRFVKGGLELMKDGDNDMRQIHGLVDKLWHDLLTADQAPPAFISNSGLNVTEGFMGRMLEVSSAMSKLASERITTRSLGANLKAVAVMFPVLEVLSIATMDSATVIPAAVDMVLTATGIVDAPASTHAALLRDAATIFQGVTSWPQEIPVAELHLLKGGNEGAHVVSAFLDRIATLMESNHMDPEHVLVSAAWALDGLEINNVDGFQGMLQAANQVAYLMCNINGVSEAWPACANIKTGKLSGNVTLSAPAMLRQEQRRAAYEKLKAEAEEQQRKALEEMKRRLEAEEAAEQAQAKKSKKVVKHGLFR